MFIIRMHSRQLIKKLTKKSINNKSFIKNWTQITSLNLQKKTVSRNIIIKITNNDALLSGYKTEIKIL
jgi:hypothetical protein